MLIQNLTDLQETIRELGLAVPLSSNLPLLAEPVQTGTRTLPNRLSIQPMEGCDANPEDGSPSEMTLRRYERFAHGGAGLIWVEAVAVIPEGRANPRHLWIHEGNVEAFRGLVEKIRDAAREKTGQTPVVIIQLTHAGRFSKPEGVPAPRIAYHHATLDAIHQIPAEMEPIADEELDALQDAFVRAALLAWEAGFDGVDIKGCHRYLNSELFSAVDRPGRYGGSFENRTRFMRETVDKVREALRGEMLLASRLNLFDGLPGGFGCSGEDGLGIDLAEPLALCGQLYDQGVRLINMTMGSPYYNPHVNRPYNTGGYEPPEHPLQGIARSLFLSGELKKAVPNMTVVGTGFSYLSFLSPYLAAGIVEHGLADVAGFGRQAFAYPDFARDILNACMQIQKGYTMDPADVLDRSKCCLACGKCTELMRAGKITGCAVRDTEIYLPLYREIRKRKPSQPSVS